MIESHENELVNLLERKDYEYELCDENSKR
jgi:hypothetical protein